MSNLIKTTVTINTDGINGKLNDVIHSNEVMTEVHQAFAETIDPWVPYDTGALSKHIVVDATGVVYTEPYAAKQYYGDEFHHTGRVHPLASAHWDKVAMQTQRESLAQQVKDILVRRINSD